MSSLLPPFTCLHVLSRIGFSIPSACGSSNTDMMDPRPTRRALYIRLKTGDQYFVEVRAISMHFIGSQKHTELMEIHRPTVVPSCVFRDGSRGSRWKRKRSFSDIKWAWSKIKRPWSKTKRSRRHRRRNYAMDNDVSLSLRTKCSKVKRSCSKIRRSCFKMKRSYSKMEWLVCGDCV